MNSRYLVRSVAVRDIAALASSVLIYLGIFAVFAVVTLVSCVVWLLVW